jgi:hypothetical protein
MAVIELLIIGGVVLIALVLIGFGVMVTRSRSTSGVSELIARERREMALDSDLENHITMINRVATRRASQNPKPSE